MTVSTQSLLTMPQSRSALMAQAVRQQFTHRPTLRSTVGQLLKEALEQQFIQQTVDIDLARLYIVLTSYPDEEPLEQPRYRLLLDALLEHIAGNTAFNYSYYTPEQCFVAQVPAGTLPSKATTAYLPMGEVEKTLINVYSTWVEGIKQAVVDYWNHSTQTGFSRLSWLTRCLGDTLLASANTTPGLSDEQIDVLRQVVLHPDRADRIRLFGQDQAARVYFAQSRIGNDPTYQLLSPDVLVVYRREQHAMLLQCTPTGDIQSYASLSAFGRTLGRVMGSIYETDYLSWQRYEPAGNCLETQAMIVLNTQLENVAVINLNVQPSQRSVAQLEQQIADITDVGRLFEDDDTPQALQLTAIHDALPDWLKEASDSDRLAYRTHVTALADVMRQHAGRVFNEGIESIHTYAAQRLQQQMREDQPLAPGYNPDDLIIEFAVPSGPLFTIGRIDKVTFTLTELALENLIGMPTGHMTIRHAHNQLIQDWWLTGPYIKTLIQKVDIGKTYPALIKRLLVDEQVEAQRRETLYIDYLRAQLPMLALERKIRAQSGFTVRGYQSVAALMELDTSVRTMNAENITIRPLAFVATASAVPDRVNNMFVIAPKGSASGPWVLYRPLFNEALLEYPTALALMNAIAQPGELQQSILQWLPEPVRDTYAEGGVSSILATLGAAMLFEQPLGHRFMHDLFRDGAMALIELAGHQSVSNAQSRWATLKQGGWLLFNALLPLVRGPVALAGWLLSTVTALQADIQALKSDAEGDKTPAIIDLLFNICVVLLHVAAPAAEPTRLPKDEALLPPEAAPPRRKASGAGQMPEITVKESRVHFPDVPVGNNQCQLDFSWFNNPRVRYTQAQLSWLDRNRGKDLGAALPIADGPWKGLYKVDDTWVAVIRGFNYQVALEEEGPVLVNPHDVTDVGPRIRSTDSGSWDFDTTLRLRGGGPKKAISERRVRLAQASERVKTLDARYQALIKRQSIIRAELEEERIRTYAANEGDGRKAYSYLERTARIKYFSSLIDARRAEYEVELNAFKERHELVARPDDHLIARDLYKVLFKFSVMKLYCEKLSLDLLQDVHPEYVGALERSLISQNPEGFTSFRAQMYETQKRMAQAFEAQERVVEACRQVPRVGFRLAETMQSQFSPKITDADGSKRLITIIDYRSSEMMMLRDIIPKVPLSDVWENLATILEPLSYTVESHALMTHKALFSEAERSEVLDSIYERYARAQDALTILHQESKEQFNLSYYNQLTERLSELNAHLEKLMGEQQSQHSEWLPVQPNPPRKIQSSRQLVRTRKQGILIGKARAPSAEGEPEIVDVGEFVEPESDERPGSPMANPKIAFKKSGPDQWVVIEKPVASKPPRALPVIRTEVNTALSKIDDKIQRVKAYSKQSKFPLELEEILDREAQKLDRLINEINALAEAVPEVEKPKPGTPQSLKKRLQEGANKLREQGLWILKSLPPTSATLEFLLAKENVYIVKKGSRIAMAGERQDFVQEYEILNQKHQVLWYAHFHYSALTTPQNQPNVAHLKLKAQRLISKQGLQAKAKPGEKVPQVYYATLTPKIIEERFLAAGVQTAPA